ncbi:MULTISPECIES: hypothetical protein [unclassified Deinococcus]|uniref:hypothetical protein n=1 Tax=unclassified Deinococcus TaxID=2623546 RepID=UPI0009927130|nr:MULTISPECIES: hypothetical protein [unclassified Deinococcus]OOV15383.1 hypothetical protein BXU09_12725 [Deinococcus sp. LM3]PIG99524.1 hypothetical protein AMD26_004450 [Deinococcus sp. UR1]
MPEPTPLPSLTLNHPVPVPADAAVYTGISTDHYPWTEVTADLAVRQSQEFSGVFDAWQGPRWARFVWTRGTLLGGFTRAGQGLGWAAATQGLPRASVSLTELSPSLSDLLWSTRAAQARALPGAWPDPRPALERERFHGLLISGPHCSFWSSGRVLGGALPLAGATCQVYSQNTEANRDALLAFWQELLGRIHRAVNLDATWRQVTIRLAEQHPCLDPFAQDVHLGGGVLSVDDEVTVNEFRPALVAALEATLARLGQRLIDLPVTDLRDRPEWMAAGLEAR